MNPTRADAVAALGETTGAWALGSMHARMQASEVGRRILEEQPRVTESSLDIARIRTLPVDSFGRAYANYMDEHEFSAVSFARNR